MQQHLDISRKTEIIFDLTALLLRPIDVADGPLRVNQQTHVFIILINEKVF